MGDWTPIERVSGRGGKATGRVMLDKAGYLRVDFDIFERLGSPARIQALKNADRSKVGLRAASESELSVLTPSKTTDGVQRVVSLQGALTALGRDARRLTASIVLPHTWDGDVLVLDISAVPMRDGGVS